ncbi:LA2681 family HEPN domain-containing protein [Promicromonospora sp. Populi]|uniref:LA2681 family HEPN domain-containing protein n=1 Tax=Promicromonospora sp. Populi TaxID=3239420 RepID=UPI0034E292B9
MEPSEEYQQLAREILLLGAAQDEDPGGTASAVRALVSQVEQTAIVVERAALLFMCSSVVINCGSRLDSEPLLQAGKQIAEGALDGTPEDEPLRFQILYNIANAISALADMGLEGGENAETAVHRVANRLDNRAALRAARLYYYEVATSEIADASTRSRAFCNLANSLDHSGRWAEAFDYYLSALDVDPRNGNAAGNLARLLLTRIELGIGQTGHIAAVYDKYVNLAKQLRAGTVEYAGASTAERWDALELTESEGHLSHGLDGPPDAYRSWVAGHRLALSPAVEGLGTDDPHWDNAVIEVLYGGPDDDINPPIIAHMNVLKADFLVSRRLAFEGVSEILSSGLVQLDSDTGFYVDAEDFSLFGTQYAKLILAQRSTLDVLDKTAVVANEYFKIGDSPSSVSFRKFWHAGGVLRAGLAKAPEQAVPVLALAELAMDMEPGGMYASSQILRNAGTHRIVHAALLDATGATKQSRSSVDVDGLVWSAIRALQVTRSAYLYLIDLVATWNIPEDHEGEYVQIPSLEYGALWSEPVGEGEAEPPADL